jgi:hypothetical protein
LREQILRLKSTSHVLQQDADSHVGEMKSLQQELQSSNARIQELNHALRKLHKRNQRLQHQLEQKKQERKSLVKSIKNFVDHMKKNEEHQLFCHEWLLQRGSKDHMTEDDLSVASSASSASAATSLVTDDGVATVRFSPVTTTVEEEAAHDYDLSFPRGTKAGLQFHKVERKPLVLSECALDEKESALKHFTDSFRVKNNNHDHIYLVCGHYGFDRDLNTLPALGARLVKVNGEPVGNLTLDKIKEAIKCMDCEFFTMSFCNEPLTPKQRELLQQAIHVTARKYENDDNKEEEHIDSSKSEIIDMHLEDVANRLTSFLQSARTRTYSDSAVGVINNNSERHASSSDGPTPESPASRLSSFLQGARSRIDSDPSADVSERSERDFLSSSDDAWCSLETPGSRLSSFLLHGSSRVRMDSDPVVDSTLDVVNHGTAPRAGTAPVESDTLPSLKLKQSMQTMGTKFKSLF